MNLEKLQKINLIRKAKRVGRGESSGKGKTSGKGYKGQKARGGVRLGFEGGQLPIIKRLPFRRGIGNALAKQTLTLTLDQLSVFKTGEKVNRETLLKKGLLKKSANPTRIKVVDKGSLDQALTIEVETSTKAKLKIEKAKGKVVSQGKEAKDA